MQYNRIVRDENGFERQEKSGGDIEGAARVVLVGVPEGEVGADLGNLAWYSTVAVARSALVNWEDFCY